jgi:hypothetical protein
MLDAGYWILDAGCWIKDIRKYILFNPWTISVVVIERG